MSPLFFMPYSMPLEDGEEQKLNSKRCVSSFSQQPFPYDIRLSPLVLFLCIEIAAHLLPDPLL